MKGSVERATPMLLLVYGLSLMASSFLIWILWEDHLFDDVAN